MSETAEEGPLAPQLAEARQGRVCAAHAYLTGAELAALIEALPRDDDTGRPRAELVDLTDSVVDGACDLSDMTIAAAACDGATFEQEVTFERTRFEGKAGFEGARFRAPASFAAASMVDAFFAGARFDDDAVFDDARIGDGFFADAAFDGVAAFRRIAFEQYADFTGVAFARDAAFTGARFGRTATFVDVVVHGDAAFEDVAFADGAAFPGLRVDGDATFEMSRFEGVAHFADATIGGTASFAGARVTGLFGVAQMAATTIDLAWMRWTTAQVLGPLLATDVLVLDAATFAEHLTLQASARRLSCSHTVFGGGADLFARWAEIAADGADFAGSSLLAPLPCVPEPDGRLRFLGHEQPLDGGWVTRLDAPPEGFEPRLAVLRGAKVARLTLSNVDARACRFASAHGLDELRLERVRLAEPPRGWRRTRGAWMRWTRRRTIAEEHAWRARHAPGSGWDEDATRRPEWVDDSPAALEPPQIAGVYRALRRGREREGDESGAADFYYGEMEMRRQPVAGDARGAALDRTVPRGERMLLRLYWLVSGYGLRASRALAALALTIALLAVPLHLWGFASPRSYGRALLFAAESSISLLHAPDARLTAGGELVQIALRLAGPLLFGLAVLALRGRVRR